MKKTNRKAQQLQLVRNVIRQLTPADLTAVGGGAVLALAKCPAPSSPSCGSKSMCECAVSASG